MDKNSLHFKGTYRNVYEVNRAYPNGGVDGDYVDINGWQHWWNPERGTWCVNENRDSYWDEVLSTVQNLLFSKACVSESDFPLNPTDEEKRFGYFYNGELYLWTGTNGTVRNGQYRSFGVVQGERGVGVSSIAQTSTSNVDGGKNEITVTLTNGDSYKFFTYNGTGRNKGYYYRTLDELKQAVPSPTVTDWAIVDGSVYVCDEAGVWKDTTYSWKPIKLNPFVTELNKMDMPTSTGYLYWNGQSFGWKTPVVNNGGGNTGGGTSIDLSEYSWWGRKFDPASKSITGEMSSVTGIEFQSTNGETVIRKKLHLDKNGDLCFDGNLYATGGITALGVGTTSGGGSGASLGTLLTKLNSDNPFPTANGQVLTYDGSNFVWKTSTGSGVALSPVMSAMNDQLGKTSYGTPQFLYWTGSKYTWKNESEISGGGGSIQVAQTPEYSGGSESWVSATKLRFVGITGIKPTIRPNSDKGCVDVGIPVGGGSGSSGTTSGKLRFYQDSSEETWNGESDFKIIFGSGLNVTWDSHSQITLSASGGSGGSTSTSVSWSDVTNKPSTFTPSSHTHSTSDINGLSNYVRGITVNNADKATQLANPRLIWGQSFDGTGDINGNLKMGSAGGGSIQLWMNNGNMLDRTNNILHIGYGLKESSDAEINLDAYATKVYTDNMSKHYDFKSNVFDVNSNQIHFGSETNGGRISWDAANNAFKIEGNVYATGGITALGVSNNATTSNNVDFTFKSVTANTFDVMDSIRLSNALKLRRNGDDIELICIDSNTNPSLYLGDSQNYYIDANGAGYFNQLFCDILNVPGGDDFKIINADDRSFTISFEYNGKTYHFTPSDANVGVS
ncbi:hypothetical protein [Segatella hominis]|uniref:hypothetical protein n=1 Tax=Segatella hominis TaxID=2518605 RepID=UPI003AABD4BC